MFQKYICMLFMAFSLGSILSIQAMEESPIESEEFFNAVNSGNVNKVKTILKSNPNIIHKTNDNKTALEIAFYLPDTNLRREAMTKLLLESGASIRGTSFETFLSKLTFPKNGTDQYENTIRLAHLLLTFGLEIDSNDNIDYQTDNNNLLNIWEKELQQGRMPSEEPIDVLKAHIHTRLHKAIKEGNVDEVRRLVEKYSIDINTSLSSYSYILYGNSQATVDVSNRVPQNEEVPLHLAALWNSDSVVRLLVNQLDANVNIKDNYGDTTFHNELDIKTAQFLLGKGANPNISNNNGVRPIEWINRSLSDEGLNEIGQQVERVKNIQALKKAIDGHSSSFNPYTNINNTTNRTGNDPDNNPDTILTNNPFPWKWMSGGAAIVVVLIAAYNWWQHAKAQEQSSESEETGQESEVVNPENNVSEPSTSA
jgi:ankyrin repeat protein